MTMPRFTRALLLVPLAFLPGQAAGTTVHGDLRYAGMPVSSTFSNMKSAVVRTINQATHESHYYQIPVGDTYEIPVDVPPGTYTIEVLQSPDEGRQGTIWFSGDLHSFLTADIPDATSYQVDIDLASVIHIVAPFDSLQTWLGPGRTCPFGPQVPRTFNLSWEPVPAAVRSVVEVQHYSCQGLLSTEALHTTGTSVQITQRTDQNETYIKAWVVSYDSADRAIGVMGYIAYEDSISATFAYFQAPEGTRPLHTAGQIISQVAHIEGGASWQTDLVLTNPTAADITTLLYYTPRSTNGLTGFTSTQVTIPAESSRTYDDVLDRLFGEQGAGALEVASPTLAVATRTVTPAPAGGSFGQGVTPIVPEQVLSSGGSQLAVAGGVVRTQHSVGLARSNLALNEVWGEPATVEVQLLDASGSLLGTQPVSLDPYGSVQINDVAKTIGHVQSLEDGQLRVRLTAGPGRVAATLFIVDASNDPATVPLMSR